MPPPPLSSSRPAPPPAPPAGGGRRLVDGHVHVWAPPELAASKYPYTAQLIGTNASAPPVDGSARRLLAALAREAKAASAASGVGALAVQAGCHQFDHSYLTDALRAAPPGTLAGCLLADPTQGAAAGVAALRALAALTTDGDDARRRQLYRAVRFNPYLWPGHAAEPAGVKTTTTMTTTAAGTNDDDDDDDDRRMAGPTGRALFAAAGLVEMPVCFMPFRGLLGVADDIERLMDASPATTVVIDHYGFCACSSGGELLVGRSDEWRRLLSWAGTRPQVFVKASAAVRASRAPFPHADAALYGLRALVDAFGCQRVLFGTDWPWTDDAGTFAQAVAAAAAAAAGGGGGGSGGGGDGWIPYGYEGAWRLSADAAAAGGGGASWAGGGGRGAPPPLPLTDDEAAWVLGGTARTLFPGAWDD